MKTTSLIRALVIAVCLSLSGSPVFAQQMFNGEHNLENETLDYRPAPILSGYGESEDAVVNLVNTGMLSGQGLRFADSDGSGTHNNVVWNLDGDSIIQMGFDSDGLADVFGYDGDVTINVDGHNAPQGGVLEPGSGGSIFVQDRWGNLRTTRVTMAAEPDSSATVNLVGPHANWHAGQRHIDIGFRGTAEINVLEGAGITDAQRIVVGGTRWGPGSTDANDELFAAEASEETDGVGFLNIDGPGSLVEAHPSNSNTFIGIGRRGTGTVTVSNEGEFNATRPENETGIAFWVGNQAGGDGTLIIENGGIVNVDGIFRVNSNSSHRGHVIIDGPGSQLNAEIRGDTSTNFFGNTPRDEDNPDAIGIFEIRNGGRASFADIVRAGNQADSYAEFTIDGEDSLLEIGDFLRIGFNGTATMDVTDGGRVTVEGSTHLAHNETGDGVLNIDGPGSEFEGGFIRIGDEGTALMEITGGGRASFNTSSRLAVAENSSGVLNIVGPDSILETGSFFQVGNEGEGEANITNGGRVEIPLDGGSFSSVGRQPTGVGVLNIDGEGSEVALPRLYIGSDGDLEPTGVGTVNITDGATLRIGGHLGVSNGSVIELDDGTIIMESVVEARPDVIDVGRNGSLITGTGTVQSDLVVEEGGSFIGVGDGIVLDGALLKGPIENVLAGGISAAVTEDSNREFAGPVILENVRFSSDATIDIFINSLDGVQHLIAFDEDTDFANANVVVSFLFPPSESWSDQIFDFTGSGDANYNFASVTTPPGWSLDDGYLHFTGETDPSETAFGDWADEYGLSGADAELDANPAGDGFSNLAKFAFGADPTVSTATLADVIRDGDTLILRWNQRVDEGIEYVVVESGILDSESWEAVDGAEPEVMAEPDVTPPDGYERVEWSVDIDSDENRFYRARSDIDSALLP